MIISICLLLFYSYFSDIKEEAIRAFVYSHVYSVLSYTLYIPFFLFLGCKYFSLSIYIYVISFNLKKRMGIFCSAHVSHSVTRHSIASTYLFLFSLHIEKLKSKTYSSPSQWVFPNLVSYIMSISTKFPLIIFFQFKIILEIYIFSW